MSASPQNLDLFEAVLDSLAHLIAGEQQRQADFVFPRAKLNQFDGFELLVPELQTDDWLLAADDPSDTPFWPIDTRWAIFKQEVNLGFGAGWLFKRARTLKPADWRGKLVRVFPKMYELSEVHIQVNGKTSSSTAPYGVAGKRLVSALSLNHATADAAAVYATHTEIDKLGVETIDAVFAQGFEMRREYLWSVLLGEEGSPRARFVTDPIGVRAAFRLRDIPPGRQRRAALRHWVAEHWRKSRSLSLEDRRFVAEYLRGKHDFVWNGFRCKIEPSRDDIKRNNGRP